jgi:hypothetical protein
MSDKINNKTKVKINKITVAEDIKKVNNSDNKINHLDDDFDKLKNQNNTESGKGGAADVLDNKKVMGFDTPEELRKLIQTITEDELKKISKEDLQQIYDKAKEAYPDSVKKMSRKERDNLYALQEQLFGKLDHKVKSSLENIGETLVHAPETRKKKIRYNIPGNGAVIMKEFKGKKLEIKIVENGFEYESKFYKSLSVLAKEISGYAISGPIFFGLRKPKEKIAA